MSDITSLCREKRGVEKLNKTIGNDRLMLQYIMPLSEVILDFHDSLKRISSGYASFDYEDYDYQISDIMKVIKYYCVPCLHVCFLLIIKINYALLRILVRYSLEWKNRGRIKYNCT